MSQPQGYATPQGHEAHQEDGYQQPTQSYEDYETQAPPGVPAAPPQGPAPGARKKRAYAGQAYELGAGANVPQPGQPGQVGYSGYSQQAEAAGYAQGGYQQQPAAAQTGQTPMYGYQDGGSVGGYQPPAPAYPVAGQAPNVAQVTQQFGQMDMSQKPAAAQPAQRAPVLNQLYPVDLLNQPFNVAELDYPPPPAILPPNVSTALPRVPIMTLIFLGKRHAFSHCQLPSQICQIDAERDSHDTLFAEEVEVAIRSGHTTIWRST